MQLDTQWRTVQGAVTGLDYNTLVWGYEACGVKKKDRMDVFHAIQTLEQEAIKQMNAE